jgi:hypothetical protein
LHLSPRDSCVGSWVLSVMMLGGGGTFERWGLVPGNQVIEGTAPMGPQLVLMRVSL